MTPASETDAPIDAMAPATWPVAVRPARTDDLPLLGRWLGRAVALPPAGSAERLWVAPDEADRPRATLRLRPVIGLAPPRASWHVGCTVHAARELGLFHRQRTLLLGHDHTGAGELADMAWAQAEPEADTSVAQQAAALQALVGTALLEVAAHRADHAARLVAELPGVRDGAGQSPFWHGLGRHFFAGDPQAAAAAHGPDWRGLVAALLPRQVVCASFLSDAAQAAIAQVAPAARVLREVLEEAGLRYGHHVNVEDGGPILEAETDALPGITRAGVWPLQPVDGPTGALRPWLLRLPDAGLARVLRVPARVHQGVLRVSRAVMPALAPADEAPRLWAVPVDGRMGTEDH
jgi:arginine N-succinyltransferase